MNTTRRLVFDVFDPFRDELDAMIDRAAEEAMAEIARMIRRAQERNNRRFGQQARRMTERTNHDCNNPTR